MADRSCDIGSRAGNRNLVPELTGLSVKRTTSLNAPRARTAAIVALARRGSIDNGVTASLRNAHCQGALRAVARLSHSFSLNTTPWDQALRAAEAGIEEADNEQLALIFHRGCGCARPRKGPSDLQRCVLSQHALCRKEGHLRGER